MPANPTHDTLIGDPSPAMRSWVASGLQRTQARVTECDTGWELLWHLSERRFDLVVTGAALDDLPGPSLLAMARTAGLTTPFIVILPFCRPVARARLSRLAPVEIVEHWCDAAALRDSRDRLHGAFVAPQDNVHPSHALRVAAGSLLRARSLRQCAQ